ncbi:MAG: glycoside hydrolase family 2 [Bacteroidales bacterium]|nr:glycoside hydrolase family 2 [Bacteroidales bacterium]
MRRILSFISALALFAAQPLDASVAVHSLGGEWKLKFFPQPAAPVTTPEEAAAAEGRTVTATVPGNVEIDLEKAGLIADPMIGNNIYTLRKWEGYQWCYSKTFTAPLTRPGQSVTLCFDGLDTFAEIYLNGKHIGSAANMLIEHEYDVTELLQDENKLEVIIRSSVLESQKYFLGALSVGNFANEEGAYARRAPSTYGWDIMPRLVSAGIWRDVRLRIDNPVCITDVHWMTTWVDVPGRKAGEYLCLQARMPFEAYDNVEAVVSISRGGKEAAGGRYLMRKAVQFLTFNLEDVDFWWPRGYGEPALYDVRVQLVDINTGEIYDTDSRRIGIRTVRLDMDDVNLPDKPGRFQLVVNGIPVFAKGTNWVPMDALHSRDAAHYGEAVGLMVDMNCNIARCWGGNVYEDHRFFDLCDENGIMVWQDFAMGCCNYSQRDDFAAMMEEEAISVVRKLRNHPSLVLWSGNNENDQSMVLGRMRPFRMDPNRDRTSRQTLARVVYEFDPTRPYLPSSPYYSPRVLEREGKDEFLPENHLWGPRGYYKADFYTRNPSQFVSEIGYHGCPNMETLEKMFTPGCVNPWEGGRKGMWNDEWQTKANRIYDIKLEGGRNDLMTNQVKTIFGEIPDSLEDFIYASQSVQAEAMKYFVERWRGGRPCRTGIIWWNIRDGWPLLSDAVSDYYGGRKRAFHYLKNVHRNVCCLICDDGAGSGNYYLKVDNQTLQDASGEVEVSDVASGKLLYRGSYEAPANAATLLKTFPARSRQGMLLVKYTVGGETFHNHYLYGEPPYRLEDYRSWMKKIDIYEID